MILVFCSEWLRYGWFSISLFMAFNFCVVLWHLHLLYELSHTLSLLRLLIVWNLFMCSLDHCSMYYNCFILHLASCASEVCWDLFRWWVHWLFTLLSTSCSYGLDHGSYGLGPKERDILCHNALLMTHVCSVMVFVSHVDVTFSWMVLPLLWDEPL
jgi:hypothetical protein